MKRLTVASVALALVATVPVPGWAQGAGARSAAADQAAGRRLRAVYVCPGDEEAMVQHALVAISAPEFRTFSQAYPQTIGQWMTEDAEVFNSLAMREGIDEACRRSR